MIPPTSHVKENDLELQFLKDELDRLEDAENRLYDRRTAILQQLFAGASVGAILLAAFTRNVFQSSGQIVPNVSDYLTNGFILFFVSAGSFICWERLVDGAASIEVTRSKRAVVRRGLTLKGYRYAGYVSDDINTADGGRTIKDQSRGFTSRTVMALMGFLCIFWFSFALAIHSLAHFVCLFIVKDANLTPNVHSGAAIVHVTICLILFWRLERVRQTTNQISSDILGGLTNLHEIKADHLEEGTVRDGDSGNSNQAVIG